METMSDFMIRSLAAACATKLASTVEAAVVKTVRDQLPGAIEAVLREQYPGETVRIYVPKRSVSSRRDRDAAIRTQYNGRNVQELSARFGLSRAMIFRIVGDA